jgi:hypothetical protein
VAYGWQTDVEIVCYIDKVKHVWTCLMKQLFNRRVWSLNDDKVLGGSV